MPKDIAALCLLEGTETVAYELFQIALGNGTSAADAAANLDTFFKSIGDPIEPKFVAWLCR